MSTPILNVSVLSAQDIRGVSGKSQFCVYVRLQGQAMRTNSISGNGGRVTFNERFRLQYRFANKSVDTRLSVELWNKSLFSQKCVSVGWIQLEQQQLVPRIPATFNVTGGFESRQATVTVQLTLELPNQMQAPPPKPSGGTYPYQAYQQQQPPQQNWAPANPYQANPYQIPVQPAVGVPLMPEDPYTSAAYMPSGQPPVVASPYTPQQGYSNYNAPQQNYDTHQCTSAPLPPPDYPPRPNNLPAPSYPPELYSNNGPHAL